ncbi:TonB-linked SusC/RagA family outer membrane protein [Marinilabilia salmonicolor]|jgi:TonB-linked SusC/RagA family outer membrane protein|uniref:SusC/RagA family TonB-linked outer membrane protein n=1 Tax=Marinilabilia salmonicolor TaxID=989 RepID=UPI000D055591|nr:TonB-dependent receptor [Marinilabilia salmonicolor]PRZ00318.1 TonB-linked SusC/RagA family outer membrane protein [Marinilabilia salmonicolor]
MKKVLLALSFLMVFGLGSVLAQAQTITGTVTGSEDGMPIPGVSVFVKGTTVGTVTQVDGTYSLNVPEDAETIVFSFIGMQTQEVIYEGQSTINVGMVDESFAMDEVIVVAYGTSTKGSFTGSAAEVSSEKIEKRQVSNVSQALSGAVAGVQVLSNNGQPGSEATVRVRGVGSINAGTDPLYVVDGIPFDGDLSSINTSDIKSMTVLKDAASTALYGARGANGIIMITTKEGSGKAKVNLNVKYGFNSRAVENYDVLTSSKNYMETAYRAIYNAGIYNLGYSPVDANIYANSTITSETEGGLGYTVFTVPDGELLIGANGKLNPHATLGYSDGEYFYTPDDWADETFQNNPRQEYNISISGGTEKQSYYVSFGYLDDQGVISGSGFERFSGRFKGDHEVTEWLKVGANVNYNNVQSDYPEEQTNTSSSGNAFFVANYIAPVYPLYVRDGENGQIMINNGRKVYDYGDGVSTNYSRSFMSIANPAGDLTYNKTDYLMDIVNSSWHAELSPVQGLKLIARYGLNVDNTRYGDLGNAYMGQSASYGGTAYQEQTRTVGFNQQYIGSYQKTIGEDNSIDVTIGYDGYDYRTEYIYANGQNLYNPESYYVNNVIDNVNGGGALDTYATQGIFGRVNYSYKETYFGNVAYRRDASSRFHPDNRWGDFWSASAAWIITKEPFLSADWLDMLKLKASYGEQGNDNIGNYYAYLDQFRMSGADGVFSDGALSYKGNKDITWETSTSYNVGLDFAMLRNQLIGTVEYFGRKSSDMLYYKPVAGSNGYTSVPMNIGSMTNSGIEVDLSYNIFNRNNLVWNVNANATFVKNKINELHPDLEGEMIDGSRIYREGESMYHMYLVDYAGVDSETGEALYWAENEEGTRIRTADYTLAQSYKVMTDDLLPTVYGGLGTSVEAFGFDASVQASYQLGGDIYDSGYARLMHGGTSSFAGNNWHKDIYNAWRPDNKNTDVPRLDANDRYANSTSTRFLTSSDYLSINNITIGYTLPSDLVSTFNIEKLRIYFSADNVALLTSRKGLDPRQSFTAATTARYTPIRTISGGLSLVF